MGNNNKNQNDALSMAKEYNTLLKENNAILRENNIILKDIDEKLRKIAINTSNIH